MSNKPKIYANCDAGCRWETVHKSDVLEWVSHIKVTPDENGGFKLEVGKEYRITANIQNNKFICNLTVPCYLDGEIYNVTFTDFPVTDKYADSFVFKLLECFISNTNEFGVVYEFAGVRYEDTILDGKGSTLEVATDEPLYLSNATSVLVLNSGIEIKADIYAAEAEAAAERAEAAAERAEAASLSSRQFTDEQVNQLLTILSSCVLITNQEDI